MFHALKLKNFKNFEDAELRLGPLSILVGANAAGKSNIRDAFRLLHAVSRGYSIAEAIGEKWIEGGVLQWKGIRGGTREIAGNINEEISVSAELDVPVYSQAHSQKLIYSIGLEVDSDTFESRVTREKLTRTWGDAYFDSHPGANDPVSKQNEPHHLMVRMAKSEKQRRLGQRITLMDIKPAISQIASYPKLDYRFNRIATNETIKILGNMRFLDLMPDAMRKPSIPGQLVLGDQGDNLSSVLESLCQDKQAKNVLLEWVRQLTPLDAADLEFSRDLTGRVLLVLVERNGNKISANSASDGTLRFLAMAAALLGPQAAGFYFLEELDNGIHPTRLALLIQLIIQAIELSKVQVVATTHSPDLLTLLPSENLDDASVIWRDPESIEGRISQIRDLPHLREILKTETMGSLHASGWIENVLALQGDEE